MKVNEKLSILFLLEKAKKDKDNKCPITIRITIDGKRAEISLGKKLSANDWDQEKEQTYELEFEERFFDLLHELNSLL